MARLSHHILPHGEGWAVKKGGATRASRVFETKKAAVDYGREVSRRQRSELVLHDREGSIRNADSHGNDPEYIPG